MDIRCTQNIFKSANGYSNVTYYIFMPQGVEIRGIVQIAHGMCEYFPRYTMFAKYLCSLGLIVCGNDHIGHGASARSTAELGFFAQEKGWRFLIDDMKKLTHIMQMRYPDLPYYVFGHSMGSMVTRLYLAECEKPIQGAIICGTIGPNPVARMAVNMSDSIARSKGMTYRSAMLHKLAFKKYNKRIQQEKTVFDWLSRDESTVEMFQKDEKCNFIFTATGFRDLFMLTHKCNHIKCFKSTPRNLPILMIAGDHDPAGGYGEGVRRVARMYKAAGLQDLDVIFYKDARHEILNEINQLEVFADISRWIEKHLTSPSDTEDQEKAQE